MVESTPSHPFISTARIIVLATVLGLILAAICGSPLASAQTHPTAAVEQVADVETGRTLPAELESDSPLPFLDERVEIDWGAKLAQGGKTMFMLLILSVTGLAGFAERFLAVRLRYVAPDGLANRVTPQLLNKDYAGVRAACQERPSTLSRVIIFIMDHRENPVDTVQAGASDIAEREIRDMLARTSPLAVVASLAPLLGLLGTMIGMIEAFELVSIYGDDGGASMLAGSIAKALITTAVGLMIAIPAIAAYHFIKHRVNHLTNVLETDTEAIINRLYLKKSEPTGSDVAEA